MRALTCLALLAWVGAASADGIIIPEPWAPPLSVKYHRVKVDVHQQAARTEIDQVFVNPAPRDIEGTYLFPLPKQASFSAFSMEVDGQPLAAEVMNADQARRLYEEIVRQRIDPALLEYVGQGAYRARIYPIPASGEKRVQLAYDELLTRDAGVVRYVYPLNTEKFSAEALEDVSVTVDIQSDAPIKAVYSPSHPISVERDGEYRTRVVYADENVTPNTDFVLYYTVAADPVGVDLLTYLPPDEQTGYYLMLAAPEFSPAAGPAIAKRLIFVMDRSGSMAGEQMEQARGALRYAINTLEPGDAVNIVDYATAVDTYADSAVIADAAARQSLLAYVDAMQATGGTDIHGALLAAMGMLRGDDRAEMVVFLTDGKPTVGVTDVETILADVAAANDHGARLFVFGVGLGVNTHLLDRLSGQNGGQSTYVEPGEDIELAVSSFCSKVSSPVLEDLELAFAGARRSDYYPPDLPDLFRGSQVSQLGRLAGTGPVQVVLSGRVGGQEAAFERQLEVKAGGADFLPRLWATRKVGYLLDQIRLHGEDQELIDAIVEISKRYGIITPYTSFLIVEDEAPPPSVWAGDALRADSGAGAVAASEAVRAYAAADNTNEVRSAQVRYAGTRTFYLRSGVWQDSQLDVQAPVREYGFGTGAYFALVAARPELGPYLALGKEVAIAADGYSIRIRDVPTAVGQQGSVLPASPRLEQNTPNPFNSGTQIRFELADPQAVCLQVYDLSGQQVATLLRKSLPAGTHIVSWDGTGRTGTPLASGVYLYRLEGTVPSPSRKLILLK